MKRLLAVLSLSLVLTVSLVPAFAFAAETGNLAASVIAPVPTALTAQGSTDLQITVKRASTGKVAMKVGGSYKLSASATAGKLTYKSSNKKVATVSAKGVVKARRTGKATIIVTAKSGSGKATEKIAVSVLAQKKYKAVKSLKAKASSSNLKTGKTTTIKTVFTPAKASNKNVTYKSSNPKVLTVSATGKVAAIKAGKAKVTVTSCDNAKAKSTVTIKVTESVPDVTGVSIKSELSRYTWAELKKLSNAIAEAKSNEAGLALAKKYHLVSSEGQLVGDRKPVRYSFMDGENKVSRTADVRIAGFRHDMKASGGKAGITFEFCDDVTLRWMNFEDDNAGGWKACDMRSWLNKNFYEGLQPDLRDNIVAVKKKTNNTGWVQSSDTSVVTTTKDKLWLLSVVEVYGTDLDSAYSYYQDVYRAEGKQYQYYEGLGVTGSDYSNVAPYWHVWLRSPLTNRSDFFCSIDANQETRGEPTGSYASFGRGVFPAFCL